MKFVRWIRRLLAKDPFSVGICPRSLRHTVVRRRDRQVVRTCKDQEEANAEASILNTHWHSLSN